MLLLVVAVWRHDTTSHDMTSHYTSSHDIPSHAIPSHDRHGKACHSMTRLRCLDSGSDADRLPDRTAVQRLDRGVDPVLARDVPAAVAIKAPVRRARPGNGGEPTVPGLSIGSGQGVCCQYRFVKGTGRRHGQAPPGNTGHVLAVRFASMFSCVREKKKKR